jgi:hypothetical protein
MSRINNTTVVLACNAVGGGACRQYLWYLSTDAAAYAAARAAVVAQVAAGQAPTGYYAASPAPAVCAGPWVYPQDIWAFVVAEGWDGSFKVAQDFVTKCAGDCT